MNRDRFKFLAELHFQIAGLQSATEVAWPIRHRSQAWGLRWGRSRRREHTEINGLREDKLRWWMYEMGDWLQVVLETVYGIEEKMEDETPPARQRLHTALAVPPPIHMPFLKFMRCVRRLRGHVSPVDEYDEEHWPSCGLSGYWHRNGNEPKKEDKSLHYIYFSQQMAEAISHHLDWLPGSGAKALEAEASFMEGVAAMQQ